MPSLASFSTIEGLKELMHLSTLISHNLSFSEITDEKLKELGNLSTLTSLDLRLALDEHITADEAMKELRHMSGLTYLNLDSCYEITDAGLKDLGHMVALISYLNLSFCTKITDAGLKELVHYIQYLCSL